MAKLSVNLKKERNSSYVKLKKKNSFIAIIMKSNHSLMRFKVSKHKDKFRYDGHTYFISPEGDYIDKRNNVCALYLEGASTPLNHDYIETETVTEMIKDLEGNSTPYTYEKIKSLNYDSNIADMLLNRNLANVFTKQAMDLGGAITLLLLVVVLGVGIVNVAVQLA